MSDTTSNAATVNAVTRALRHSARMFSAAATPAGGVILTCQASLSSQHLGEVLWDAKQALERAGYDATRAGGGMIFVSAREMARAS